MQTIGSDVRYGVLGATDFKRIAASGNSQATAAQITNSFTVVTEADGTKGVRLPSVTSPTQFAIYSTVGDQNLDVYPNVGAEINGNGANTAYTIGPAQLVIFIAIDNTSWAATLVQTL